MASPKTDEAGRPFRGGTLLGAERGEPVEISPYDPAWPRRFEELRARLVAALGPDRIAYTDAKGAIHRRDDRLGERWAREVGWDV